MARGYAEGPAAEELMAAGDEGPAPLSRPVIRRAVYGSTADDGSRHFLGWLGDVDPDALFARGEAWGLSIIEREG